MFSPVLSVLYLSLIFHIVEKRSNNLKILVSFFSFVNDSLFISQEKLLKKNNTNLFCSYNIIFSLLKQFSLVVKHGKSEVFHFSRSCNVFNLSPLNLNHIGSSILKPKEIWCYLSFIFDRKLFFWQHVKFYANKALSTIKCIKMLKNSNQELLPHQKHFLYRTCILLITLYRSSLWHYNKVPLSYQLKELGKLQQQVAL